MKINIAKELTFDELRNKYREYLQLLTLSQNTISTSLNDVFYLWKHESKELFWEKIAHPDFETVYRASLLESLSKHSKGNPKKLVNPYVSSARKFRCFLECNEAVAPIATDSLKTATKPKVTTDVPRPCASEVESYLAHWDKQETYHLQEDALDKLFLTLCPDNKNISDVLLKVSTLNNLYSTHIFSVYPVAKHILSLDIDARIKAGDVTLVNDIQKVTIKGVEKNFYSFATKYCSHHNSFEYPIYDSYVDKVLMHFRKSDGFAEFTNTVLKDYIHFKEVLIDFRKFYHLEQYNLKEIDKYIWQLGKQYFPNNYSNNKEQL